MKFILCTSATPYNNSAELSNRASTPISEGWHNGYFYSWWADNQGTAYYANGDSGQYSVQWSSVSSVLGGKGWNPGIWDRVINYSGLYKPSGNSYLAVYGWTRNSLIEYYIIESYGSYNPSSAFSKKGTVSCNGGKYDIVRGWRRGQPSIDGVQTFQQFLSIRNPQRTPGTRISGTIDTACHFNAWRDLGMTLGADHYYQIVATEGYYSSGQSSITVW
ncbi:hypothetical protein D9619_011875 [Psilocybe cf. subviscida]|uniref:Endo-1,4-beta-xylanase n=1 Tax=Psilocybe cf. subviscida TaxID=2480587 RepID=A0A8H5EW21_9AGAR|nr:hypothetical protein D9619_011875 [Psilocybe cf. subviscida]